MRDGIYRVHYETTILSTTATVVLHNNAISGCDRYYFIFGQCLRSGNELTGTATFRRHTDHPDLPAGLIPETFEVRFQGICGDDFGEFDIECPDVPAITGRGRFTWLGSRNFE